MFWYKFEIVFGGILMNKNVRRDKYISTLSYIVKVPSEPTSVTMDLTLKRQPVTPVSQSISGSVKDVSGNPIESAYVQLYSNNKNPIRGATTNKDGRYVINNVEAGEVYFISAIAQNKDLSNMETVELQVGVDKIVNFVLEENLISELSVISGTLTGKEINNTVVSGAIVSLYKLEEGKQPQIVAVTFSNEQGKYVLREIGIGRYAINVTALGYAAEEQVVTIDSPKTKLVINFTMYKVPAVSEKSFIQGIISDDYGKAIVGADVILYRIDNSGELVPVALTRTNDSGKYLFADVPDGNYRVISNDSIVDGGFHNQKLEITGPDVVEPGKSINLDVKYTSDKQTVQKPGIALKSSNTEIATTDAFTVTGIKVGRVVITAYLVNEPEIFAEYTVYVSEIIAAAPDISRLRISQAISDVPIIMTASQAELYGTSRYDSETGKIINIGFKGENQGIGFAVDVPLAGKYDFAMDYSSQVGTSTCIYANGTLNQDIRKEVPASGVEITTIELFSGKNYIKIQGGEVYPAFDIKRVAVRKQPIEKLVTIADLTEINPPAKIFKAFDTEYIYGITGEGFIKMSVDTQLGGEYTAKMRYVGPGQRVFKMDINDVKNDIVYQVEKGTETVPLSQALDYEFTLKLDTGKNTIKMHTNLNTAPDFHDLKLIQKQYDEYINAVNAKLEGTATVKGEFVTQLGNSTGSMSIEIDVPYQGEYDFIIDYVAPDLRAAELEINGQKQEGKINFEITPSLDIKDIKSKVIRINFNKGKNIIKIM